jgi:hypothetical protein
MQRRWRGCRGDSSVADHSLLLRSLVNSGLSSLHHCSGRSCSGWIPLHMDNVIPLPLPLQGGGGSCGHASSHGNATWGGGGARCGSDKSGPLGCSGFPHGRRLDDGVHGGARAAWEERELKSPSRQTRVRNTSHAWFGLETLVCIGLVVDFNNPFKNLRVIIVLRSVLLVFFLNL